MPAGAIRGLAKRYGVTFERAEAAWNACKKAIDPDHKKAGYGVVMNCVKAKLRKKK